MNSPNRMSLRTAALVAGLALLLMTVAAPFAELYVFPKLVVSDNAAQTSQNILANEQLFVAALLAYAVTFLCDILAAWGLYVLLRPVHEDLSMLTAWFRLVYTVISLAALLNLVTVLRLLKMPVFLTAFGPDQLNAQVMLALRAFRSGWYFGIVFFGIHLGLLGYLVFRSDYIPKILGILLIIAGVGYVATTLRPYLFPDISLDLAKYTFVGELIFMLWLLIRGSRIKQVRPTDIS